MQDQLTSVMEADKFYRRLPLYKFLAVGLTFLAVVICCLQQITRADGDPELFVFAARQLLNVQNLYGVPTPHGNFYYYPPFFAFLNIALIPLPRIVLIFSWALASVGLLGWSIATFYSGMAGKSFRSIPAKTRWVVCFFAVLLVVRFVILHLRFGQTNILILALVILGLWWIKKNHQIQAGTSIAVSIAIKLITLPFGVWFLARRSYKVLLGMTLGGVICLLLPALIVGFRQNVDYHRQWAEKVVSSNAAGSGNWTSNGNLSLRAQADRFFLNANAFEYKGQLYRVTIIELSPVIVGWIGRLIMFGVCLIIFWYALRFRQAPELIADWGGYALIFSLIPQFSTITEIPHLVLLLPAYLYVVHLWYGERLADRVFRLLIVLSFVLTTLTTKTFCGEFLSRLFASIGLISLGILLLSAAIIRAAYVYQEPKAEGEAI